MGFSGLKICTVPTALTFFRIRLVPWVETQGYKIVRAWRHLWVLKNAEAW